MQNKFYLGHWVLNLAPPAALLPVGGNTLYEDSAGLRAIGACLLQKWNAGIHPLDTLLRQRGKTGDPGLVDRPRGRRGPKAAVGFLKTARDRRRTTNRSAKTLQIETPKWSIQWQISDKRAASLTILNKPHIRWLRPRPTWAQ